MAQCPTLLYPNSWSSEAPQSGFDLPPEQLFLPSAALPNHWDLYGLWMPSHTQKNGSNTVINMHVDYVIVYTLS